VAVFDGHSVSERAAEARRSGW